MSVKSPEQYKEEHLLEEIQRLKAENQFLHQKIDDLTNTNIENLPNVEISEDISADKLNLGFTSVDMDDTDDMSDLIFLNSIDGRTIHNKNYLIGFQIDGKLYMDLPIVCTDLSIRIRNCLFKMNITHLLSVLNLKITEITAIRNLGAKSIEELFNFLRTVTVITYIDEPYYDDLLQLQIPKKPVIKKIINTIYNDINDGIGELVPYTKIEQCMVKMAYLFPDDYDTDNFVKDYDTLSKLYVNELFYTSLVNKIETIIKKYPLGITEDKITENLPKSFRTINLTEYILIELCKCGKVYQKEDKYIYEKPSIIDVIKKHISDERLRNVALDRLTGMTTRELGKKYNVSPQMIHFYISSVYHKYLKDIPVKEDIYRYWYENYDIRKSDFTKLFDIPESAYIYIADSGFKPKGTKKIRQILTDVNIDKSLYDKVMEMCSKHKDIVIEKDETLAYCYPDVAKDWHPTKNGDLTPEMVRKSANKKVWWLCPVCNTEYQATIHNKVQNSRKTFSKGCPTCRYVRNKTSILPYPISV